MGSKLKQYNLRIEENLLNDLTNKVGDNVSEFIRDAIIEKLNRKKISMDETYNRLKKIDKIDTDSIYKKVNDIEFTLHVIFEETKKQNEILKLILRRATFAGVFGGDILKKMDASLKAEREQESINRVASEVEQLKL